MQQLSRRFLHSSRPWRPYASAQVARSALGTTTTTLPLTEKSSCRWTSSSTSRPPFDKILIANRGEIACRVIRTCRRLGVQTVAIYSSADATSLHASMADERYCIGTGPSATDSYLRGDEVLDIALRTGAQAIHPGYGFLSENADFCQRVTDASLAFVGPGPKAIQAMGDKSQSKAIMDSAGVPTTPGYHGSKQDPNYLLHEAVTNVGFPLLIKAVMGGGGKGMRLVWNETDFLSSLASCKRESQSAFGDSTVLLEKYLVHPRHVEVQIVADTFGNVIHLNERDCSLQRRHQKIIEEAPASDLPLDLREQLGNMGKRAAEAVGYVNAGTVEFLLDTQHGQGDFYFCEMNTRLQVEHPITELITGVDLVEWQLRIAAGEELPITSQSDIPCLGHAMEARIYAENPARDFLPATGNVWHHRPPAIPNTDAGTTGVRVDTGIQPGQDIGVYYDPMISKLIVHGDDRMAAVNKLISSLKQYQIAGVPTNLDFLVQCAQHATFQRAGALNTGFLEHHGEEVEVKVKGEEQSALARAIGVFATLLQLEKRVGVDNLEAKRRSASPWSQYEGSWRMGGPAGRLKRTLVLIEPESGDETSVECWSNHDGSFDIDVPSGNDETAERFTIDGTLDSNLGMQVLVNGNTSMALTAALKEEDGDIRVHVWNDNTHDEEYSWEIVLENPLMPSLPHSHAESASVQGTVKAPMPGKITRINASVGDEVSEGDVLVVMEAMKMEHAILAPRDGVLVDIGAYSVGDVVEDGSLLARVEQESDGIDGRETANVEI